MKAVTFTPLAKNDINDIWDYTIKAWGQKQAVSYTQALRDAAQGLADGRSIGRSVTVRPGYFKHKSGEHFLFYKEHKTEIKIIRILHTRMDVERHLK